MSIEEVFKWRDSKKEVPFYKMFGQSNEILGVDKHNNRSIYIYRRGEWYLSVNYGTNPSKPPIFWHYLPKRLSKYTKELQEEHKNVINNTEPSL